MNIIGLNMTNKNPSACLIQDGIIKAFVEEERLIGLKTATNQVPLRSLAYCLQEGGICPEEIDGIAAGWDSNKYTFKMPLFSAGLFLKNLMNMRIINTGGATGTLALLENTTLHRKYQIQMMLRSLGLKEKIPEIRFYQHHLAHAASAYYCSGFDRAAVLVMDGSGEENCTTIFNGEAEELILKREINIPHSLGWFYSAITEFLGFRPYEGEYKVMGLAPYGRLNEDIMRKIERILKVRKNFYEVDPQYLLLGKHTYGAWFSDQMVKLFNVTPRQNRKLNEVYKDIAFCAQAKLEEIALNLVKEATANGKTRNLCLAGGVALNCKMAGTILNSGYVDRIFVQPLSNDSGSALGAALLLAKEKNDFIQQELENVYFGPGYSDKFIEQKIKASGLNYSYTDNSARTAAEQIGQGKVVGWFQGRMESGPRALGNRSILANPMAPEMKDKINKFVKFREPWRPFAPSILEEAKDDFLIKPSYAPFMTITFKVKEEKVKVIPSVTHVDGTTRPQMVRKSVNPLYWSLLNRIGEITGLPAVLNTSLNIKGKPIVCSPVDAIEFFATTGLEVMVIGHYVLLKK